MLFSLNLLHFLYFDTQFDTFCAFDDRFLYILIENHETKAKIPENPIHLHAHA